MNIGDKEPERLGNQSIISITEYEEAVESIIATAPSSVTIIGEPGTGKTTRVPTELANRGYSVFVVIPTKMGVHFAHDYIKKKATFRIKQSVKDNMGTAADSKIRYVNSKIAAARSFLYGDESLDEGVESKIVYCTPGHIKKVLLDMNKYVSTYGRKPSALFCDYLIVDEVHLETIDIDMTIRYWTEIKESFPNVKLPVLIKMSATYFSDGLTYKHVSGRRPYNTQIDYFDNVGEFLPDNLRTFNPKPHQVMNFIPDIIIHYLLGAVKRGESGTMLVFLPGITSIKSVEKTLLASSEMKKIGKYEIARSHSSLKTQDPYKLSSGKPDNIRWLIVLSTNICETSITIPGVTYVIDSGFERIAVSGSNDVVTRKTVRISKRSADQRAGRTGRDSHGVVFRCCFKDDYKFFEDKRANEISRLPITTEMLRAMQANINVRKLFFELPVSKLNKIFKDLSDLCCLRKCGDFYNVTEMGDFVSEIPLSVRNAVVLGNWLKLTDDIFPGVVLAVAIESIESVFNGDFSDNLRSTTPLGVILNAFLLFFSKTPTLTPNPDKLRKFATSMNLNADGLVDAFRKIMEILRILGKRGHDIDIFMFDPESAMRFGFPSIKKSYPLLKRDSGAYYTMKGSTIKYSLSTKYLSIGEQYPDEVYAILIVQGEMNSFVVDVWIPSNYVSKNTSVDNYDLDENEIDDDNEIDDKGDDSDDEDDDGNFDDGFDDLDEIVKQAPPVVSEESNDELI